MAFRTLESQVVQENWRELLDTTTSGQSDVVITLYGKPVTAMIRYADYIALQDELAELRLQQSEAYQTMLASEVTLVREWDTYEEDEAWADL